MKDENGIKIAAVEYADKDYIRDEAFYPIWEKQRDDFIAGAMSDAAKEYHINGMYTKEEVKALISRAMNFFCEYKYFPSSEWFKENLES